MNKNITDLSQKMFDRVLDSMAKLDYRYWECNSVPEKCFTQNSKLKALIRLFFRLCPINFRPTPKNNKYPILPQYTIALLQETTVIGNRELALMLTKRIEKLRSSMTSKFSIAQGNRICISLYDDSSDTPSSLLTPAGKHLSFIVKNGGTK